MYESLSKEPNVGDKKMVFEDFFGRLQAFQYLCR